MLVCFQPINTKLEQENDATSDTEEASEASQRQKNLLVRRALECGLQLLARLSHYRVYLTAEERSKHRSPVPQSMNNGLDIPSPEDDYARKMSVDTDHNSVKTFNIASGNRRADHKFHWVPGFIKGKSRNHGKMKDRRFSNTSESSSATATTTTTADINNSVDLELHIALSCGNVTNIILGDLNPDSYVNPTTSYPQLRPSGNCNTSAGNPSTTLDEFFLEYHGRLEYAIGGDIVDSLDEALSIAKAGELSITPAAYDIAQRQSMSLHFERRKRFFVIKNIIDDLTTRSKVSYPSPLRHNSTSASRKASSAFVNSNAEYLKTLPGLRTEPSKKLAIDPLVPRVRNTYHMKLPMESNSYYFKYINRSALYRMQHSVDGNLPAQFREVTIMFVSLGKTDVQRRGGLVKVQKAVLLAIKALVKYEGMLQQFAIDDKGKSYI